MLKPSRLLPALWITKDAPPLFPGVASRFLVTATTMPVPPGSRARQPFAASLPRVPSGDMDQADV